MSLATLAPELLEAICDNVDESDVRDLRLVCRTLAETLSQTAYRKFEIHFRHDCFKTLLTKLQLLADGEWPQGAQGTRILVLRSLSPRFNPDQPGPSWSYMNGTWQEIPDPPSSAEVLEAEKRIKELLPAAIATLKGVHTVDWDPCRHDGWETQARVADAIVALPNVRHFTLDTARYEAPLPLARLPPLISLDVYGRNASSDEETRMDQVSKCIAKSPHLSSLTLARDYNLLPSLATSLHNVMKDANDLQGSPLNLTSLALTGFYIRLDAATLPHLQNLRSLTIAGFEDPENLSNRRRLDGSESDDESLPVIDTSPYAASFPDLWRALKMAGIELSHLNVHHMSNALIEYIESYSGLQDLKIYVPDYFNDSKHAGNAGTGDADMFWDALGRNHGGTLHHLDVYSGYEGQFCFSRSRVPALKQCKHLISLRVPVFTSRVFEDDSDLAPDHPGNVALLLDTVALHLSKLEQLTIAATSNPWLRFSLCGNPSRLHFRHASGIMNQWVSIYSAPVSCERLPDLEVEVLQARTKWKSLVRPRLDHVAGDAPPSPNMASSRRLLHLEEDECQHIVVPLPPMRQTTLAYQKVEEGDEGASETIYL